MLPISKRYVRYENHWCDQGCVCECTVLNKTAATASAPSKEPGGIDHPHPRTGWCARAARVPAVWGRGWVFASRYGGHWKCPITVLTLHALFLSHSWLANLSGGRGCMCYR